MIDPPVSSLLLYDDVEEEEDEVDQYFISMSCY